MRRIFCFSRSWTPYSEIFGRRSWPCCPGGYERRSTGHFSVKHFVPFRKSFWRSLRHNRQTGPTYLPMFFLLVLNATTLGWTAAVMRHRRDVPDAQDIETDHLERADARLAPGAGPLDVDIDLAQAEIVRLLGGSLGGHLGGEGGILARSLEAVPPGGRPADDVAVHVGDGHDDVVEGRTDERLAREVDLNFLFLLRGRRLLR